MNNDQMNLIKPLVRAVCTYATVYEMEHKTSFGEAFTEMRKQKEEELHIAAREFFHKVSDTFLSTPPSRTDGATTRPEGEKVSG